MLVGDIIGVSSLAARLPTSSTGLEVKLLTTPLESIKANLCPARKVNMNRCSHTSTKICWARVDITILFVKHEVFSRFFLDRFLNSFDSSGKSLEDTLNITSLLHGNDTKLIFLIDPGKEGFGSIVVDTTSLWPVSFHTSNLEISVTRHEKEVIINELLSDLLVHTSEGIVGSLKISLEVSKGFFHKSFNTLTLFFGDTRGKTKSIDRATDSDTARVNWNITVNVSFNFVRVHIRSVSSRGQDSMVFLDDWVENNGKVLVRIPVTSIDTAMLVVKFNRYSNSLVQCESRGLCLDVLEFLPFVFGDMFGYKRVLRLDDGKVAWLNITTRSRTKRF